MSKILNKYIEVTKNSIVNTSGETFKTREKLHYKDEQITIGKGTIIEPLAVISPDVEIGESCVLGASSVIKSNVKIGVHSIIGDLSTCQGNNNIGSWTTVNCQCCIGWGLSVGNKVFIAPFFHMANTKEPGPIGSKFGYPNTTNAKRDCGVIEDECQIGEDVGLAPGVIVGKRSVVDMHCLLTKNIPPDSHVRAGKDIIGRIV